MASNRTATPVDAPRRRVVRWAATGVVLLGLFVVAGVAMRLLSRPAISEAPSLRLSLLPPENAMFTPFYRSGTPHFALSPDGTRIAFVASIPGRPPSLWIRPLDSAVAQELPGTDDASSPFWSPDGERVGFFAQGVLKTIGLRAGRPEVLGVIRCGNQSGGAWSRSGVILVGQTSGPLSRVRAAGGPVETVGTLSSDSAIAQRWPQFLPDGRHFLFAERLVDGSSTTRLGALDSEQTSDVCKCRAVYAPPGFLLIAPPTVTGRLLVQALDPESWTPVGEPLPLLEQVGYALGARYPPVSVSASGLLAYWDARGMSYEQFWVDRTGNRLSAVPTSSSVTMFRLSPDGRTTALRAGGDLWLLDRRGARSRFTFTGADWPVWSADGGGLLYRTPQGTLAHRGTGGGDVEQQFGRLAALGEYPTDWWSDRRRALLHTEARGAAGWDLVTVSLEDGTREPLLQTPADEVQGRLSPDGRWLAYSANESGRWEVYVQPFPLTGAKWQVSLEGGSQPVWRRDGRELFFVGADGRLMAVAVTTAGGFVPATPQALFETRMRPNFEPFPFQYDTVNGERFLINTPESTPQ